MIKKLIQTIFSRKIFQPVFEEFLSVILKVLNIGEGQSVETSGERNVFEVLKTVVKNDGAVVFDVGAHTGEWLGLLRKIYKGKTIVYSFEPSMKSFEVLSKINFPDFFPKKIALGENNGTLFLSYDEEGSSGSQITGYEQRGNNNELVETRTLDSFCKENKIEQIDLLKIDTEGYELNLLRGAVEMLNNKKIKLIQFEFGAPSEQKYSFKEFFDILNKNYLIFRILQNGYYPIKEYHHYYEIITVTNFLAVRRDLTNKI
jgi:FkbM family methyltransferase